MARAVREITYNAHSLWKRGMATTSTSLSTSRKTEIRFLTDD